MAGKWIKTSFRGVEYRQHETRKHGVKFDRYFRIRFMVDGKAKVAGLGWATEGWTEQKAALKLQEYRENAKFGVGPSSLREEQEASRERREQERLAAEAAAESSRREQERLTREKVTVSQYWAEHYFPDREKSKSEKIVKNEERLFRIWIQPAIGHIPLKGVTKADIVTLKESIISAGRSNRTCEYVLAVARQIFNHVIRERGWVSENPTRYVDKPAVNNQRTRFLDAAEGEVLLTKLQEHSQQLHDISLLSLRCGLRAGEIFKLVWGDVDLKEGRIHIRNPKNGQNRHAFMTPEIRAMFERQERTGGDASEPVFKSRYGEPLKEISHTFSRAVDSLGWNDGKDSLERLTFHSLRHSFASQLVKAGTHLFVVRDLLGHKTMQMTQRYSHVKDDQRIEAVQALDNAVRKAREGAATLERSSKVIPFRSL